MSVPATWSSGLTPSKPSVISYSPKVILPTDLNLFQTVAMIGVGLVSGRARSPNALYCMMVEESAGGHSATDSLVDALAQFYAIEQILLNGTRSKEQNSEDQKKYWDNPVSTYRPNPDGPCITLSSAMEVINR